MATNPHTPLGGSHSACSLPVSLVVAFQPLQQAWLRARRFPILSWVLLIAAAMASAGAAAQTQSVTFTNSTTWIAPAGVTSITVQAWGGGGAGGGVTTNNGNYQGGGGGGGAYRIVTNITVTPLQAYPITIGIGGIGDNGNGEAGGTTTATFGAIVVSANGGAGGGANNGEGGVGGNGGTYNGGNGAAGTTNRDRGGGGSSAGTGAAGSNGSNSSINGGIAPAGGGNGGNGAATNGIGTAGSLPGGGGGGAATTNNSNYNGGSGANGQMIITYTNPLNNSFTAPGTYSFTVPPAVTSITVQAWGGGGGGGAGDAGDNSRGGGGGGAYAGSTLTVVPGTTYTVVVGAGGASGNNGANSTFGTNTIVAAGGTAGNTNGGPGGTVPNSIGTNRFAGGAGGNRSTNNAGGGGGGSAFTNAAGGNGANGGGNNQNGGAGGAGTGNGGQGGNDINGQSNGRNGLAPGGGGGGKANQGATSGAGAPGQVLITWPAPAQYVALFSAPNLGATNWCSGETRTVQFTVTNNGAATWNSNSGNLVRFSWWWNSQSGQDANPRVLPFNNLAPGQSLSFDVTITAPSTPGTYTLNYDLVKEGDCWFRDNSGSCGPGNATSNTAAGITVFQTPTAMAGANMVVCSNSGSVSIGADATASNQTNIAWSTSNGTGLFVAGDDLNGATYTPSAADLSAGFVTLELMAINGTCITTSTKTLTFTPAPVVAAGTAILTCSNSGAVLVSTGASAANAASLLWTSNGTGTFSSATTLATNYTPSPADIANGGVSLTLTATGNTGCAAVNSSKALSITAAPVPVVGPALAVCANSTNIAITDGASANNSASVLWSIAGAGNGTFTNATSINTATYTPGTTDLANGTVTLRLTATGNNPCAVANADRVITFTTPPNANAGADMKTCSNTGIVTIGVGATAGNYSSVAWSSSGTGTFTNATDLNTAAYTPSAADIAAGSVALTLTAAGNGSCNAATSTKTLTITPLPVAEFSYTGTPYCSNSANAVPTFLNGGVAGTFSSTAGLVFVNNTTGVINIAASTPGNYTVTNTIAAANGCGVVTATADISITKLPVATFSYAGSPYCSNAANAVPTFLGGGVAGTFTAAAGLNINAATGEVNLASSTPGIYTVTNTIAAANGCGQVVATASITITALPIADLNYTGTPFCSNGAAVLPQMGTGAVKGNFSASPAGLVINATTGEINPGASIAGTYTITNAIAAAGGCALVSSTTSVTITALPIAGFSYAGSPYCKGGANPVATLNTGATAGTFSSTTGLVFANAATGEINMASSTPGTYMVTNTIAAANGCGQVIATASITITALPVAGFSYAGSPFCSNGTNPTPIMDAGATIGTFSAGPGLSINSSTGLINLAASTPGNYTVTNTIAAANGCSVVTATYGISINQLPVASFSYPTATICKSAANPSPVFSGGGVAGTFSSSPSGLVFVDAATGVVNMASSTPGAYTITNTIAAANGCTVVTATSNLTITQDGTIVLGSGNANPTVCINIGAVNMVYTIGGTATGATVTGLPAGVAGSYSAGSFTISGTPSVSGTFNYTITTAGSCAAATASGTITVVSLPTVVLSSGANTDVQNICLGNSITAITYTIGGAGNGATVSGLPAGVSYSFSSGTLTISGLPTAGVGTYNYTVNTTNSNGCVNASATGTIRLFAVPPATPGAISGSISLCPTVTGLVYSVPNDNNVAYYNWVLPTGWNITGGLGTNSITVSVGGSSIFGLNVVSVIAQNPCGNSAAVTLDVLVNDFASVDAGPDRSVCQGGSVTINAILGGVAASATWSSSAGGTFSATTVTNLSPGTTYTPAISSGTVTLTLTSNDPTGSCAANVNEMIITVKPTPTASISGATTVCNGGNATISFSGTPLTEITYSVNSTDQTIQLDATGNASINTGSLSATTTYSLVSTKYITAPSCNTAVSGSVIVTVNPLVLVNAGTPQTVCADGSITLNGSITGGITTGTWSAPSGTFSNSSLLNSTYTPGITSGTVLLTLTSADPAGPCGAESATVLITVNPIATVAAGSPQTVCSNGSISLAGSIGGSATGATWSAPSGTFSNPNSLVSTYTPAIASGTVLLTLTSNDPDGPGGPCTPAVSTVTITVNAAAVANAGSPQTVCAGGTITLNGTVTGGASTGQWTAPSGSFSDANSLTSTYTPSISSGTVTLTLTSTDPDVAGPCSESVSTVVISVNAAATTNAGSNVSTCPGTPVSLSGSLGGSATSAVWSAPSGTFSNANSLTSTYTPTITSGSVTLTLTSNDPDGAGPCAAGISTVVVSITTPPANPANPTATTPGCGSVSIAQNGAAGTNEVWYWQNAANGTSTSQNATTPWVVASSGTYFIRAFNTTTGCWSNGAGSVAVVVNPLPAAPAAPTSNSPQCSDPGVTLTKGTAPTGETWYWQTTANGTDVAAFNSASTFTVSSSGTYYLRAQNNTTLCWGTATSFVVTVTPAPATPPAPTSGAAQCADIGTTLTTSGTAPSGTTWYWQTAATGTSTSSSGTTYTASTSGNYYLRARDNGTGCWSPAVSVTATVNPSPLVPATPTVSAAPNCGSATLTRIAPPANITWYWQTTANGADLANSGLTYVVTTSGDYFLRARDNVSGCWSTSAAQVTITVSAVPAAPILNSNSPQCAGVGVTLTTGTPPTGENWYWQSSASGTSTADNAATKLAAASGTYYLRSQTAAGCWSPASTLAVVVNALPASPGNPTVTGNNACEDVGVTLTKPAGQPGGVQWFWQSSATGTDQTNFGNTYVSLVAGGYNVYLRAMNTTTQCWSAGAGTQAITVRANPTPSLAAFYCEEPGKVRLRDTASTAIASYNWSPIVPAGNPNTNAIYDVDVAGRFYNTLTYSNGCSRQGFIDVADNLVANGDFEANVDYRNPTTRGFRTEYIYRPRPANVAERNIGCNPLPGCPGGGCPLDPVPLPNCGGQYSPGLYNETTYAVNDNANDYHGDFWGRDYTTGSGKFLMINGSRNLLAGNLRVIWEQTITIQANTDYYFSAWGMNLNPSSPAQLRFEINGVQAGTIGYLNSAPTPTSAAQVNRSNWVRFYSDPKWNSGAATTAVVRIVNLNPVAGGNDFGLDDISFGTLAANPVNIVSAVAESPVCPGESITLTSTISGGKAPFTYYWLGPNGFSDTLQNPVISTAITNNSGIYTLRVKDGYNCNPQATKNSNSVVVLSGTPGIWTGAGNTDWFWCRNWASGTLPTNVIDVSVPQTAVANSLIDPATSLYYAGTLNGSLPARSRNIVIDKTLSFGNTGRLNTYGNLSILNNAGSTVNMTPGGEIFLRGNWINHRGTAGFTAGVGRITMEGSVLQTIWTDGLLESFYDLRIDNSSGAANGVTVLKESFVAHTLTLKNGYLNTFSNPPVGGPPAAWPVAKELTIGPAGTAVAGPAGTQSFVTGRLAKEFNTSGAATEFEFPIGKVGGTIAGGYRPASVVPTTTEGTTTFYSEYFAYPHPTPTTLGSSLFGFIKPEYWQIDRQSGKTTVARVKLNYINPGSGNWIGDANAFTQDPCSNCNVAVIHKSAGGMYSFTGLPPNSTDPEYRFYANNGPIYSKAINTFSPFSLGFSFNVILPIQILSFDGRLAGSESVLQWTLASNQDIAGFEVQTSRDGISYTRLGYVKHTGDSKYQYVHKTPAAGPNYYRLLMQERNGTEVYSTVVVLQLGWTPITVIKGLQSNPVRNEAVINIYSASTQRVQARLIDISGRVLAETNEAMLTGNNQLRVKTQMLSQGIYQIQVLTQDGKRAILRIMKE